ncbi:MAG TPA: thermonuclease family protein [Pseudolabrys sp.]|nr:thermonuclease family protein [Pseudolabrys sp.]
MARALILIVGMLLSSLAAAQSPCGGAGLGTVTVKAVRDVRTLLLADGRTLRLAALDIPAGREAALRALEGQPLTLKSGAEVRDRYGRLTAFAMAPDAAQTVQESLLSAGDARFSGRATGKACAEALLAGERQAREARLGLWADPNFAPLRADDYGRFRAERGRFVLVEGKVLSVRQSGATIYVNFGRRFTRDLSLTILRRLRGDFTAAGVEPSSLQGRRIRARGWLEYRRGPIVDVTAPEQIEIIE